MKRIGFKQIIILLLAAVAAIFAIIGFTQLGFWDPIDGPKTGFFPSIMSIVMLGVSIIAFFQSFKEEERVRFTTDELLVIACGTGLIAATFIVGLIPSIIVMILVWMKLIERTNWKETIAVLIISLAITIGVFQIWLGIQFPMGLFENLF